MGEKESDKPAQVNLELPSFGLRRKKKSLGEIVERTDAGEGVETPAAAPPAPEPEALEAEVAEAEFVEAPAAEAAEPAAARFAPPAAPAAAAAPAAPEPVRQAPADEAAPVVQRPARVEAPAVAVSQDVAPADDLAPTSDDEPVATKRQLKVQLPEFKAPRLPVIPTRAASALTGVVIGLLACVGTYVALQGCEAIRGTSSCGGPGLLVVLAILAVLVVAGTYALKLFAVPNPAAVSTMAVGLLSMLVMAILIPWIFEWFMLIVIPVLGAGCYVVANFFMTLFDDE